MVDSVGQEQPNATVTAQAHPDLTTRTSPAVIYGTVQTDKHGHFAIHAPQCEMVLIASHPDHRPSRAVQVSAPTAHERPAIRLALADGESITTRVVDAETGKPLEGVAVTSWRADPVLTDQDGRVKIPSLRLHGDEWIDFNAEGYALLSLHRDRVHERTVPLHPGVEIRGRLLRADDGPFDVRGTVVYFDVDGSDRSATVYDGPLDPRPDGSFSLRVKGHAGYLRIDARIDAASYVVRTVRFPASGGDLGDIELRSGVTVFGRVVLPPTIPMHASGSGRPATNARAWSTTRGRRTSGRRRSTLASRRSASRG